MRSFAFLLVATLAALAPVTASAWQVVIDGGAGAADEVRAVAVDGDGNVVAAGFLSDPNTAEDAAVVKFDGETGAELWRQVIDGSGTGSGDLFTSVGVSGSGDVYGAGEWRLPDGWQIGVAKLSGANGAVLWTTVLGGSLDYAKLVVTPGGDLIVCGRGATNYTDFYVAKLSGEDGSEIWRFVLDGTEAPGGEDAAFSVALDSNGDVVVGGHIDDTGPGYDFAVIKLASANGSELWRYQTRGTGNGGGSADAVEVDLDGNIIAGGWVDNISGWNDLIVVKLSGGNGSPLWRTEISGQPSWIDAANDLVLGTDGSAYVAGYLNHGRDFLVLKLAHDTGGELWRYTIVGSATYGGSQALALAVDSGGDVAAAGFNDSVGSNNLTTVKLNASSGAELWRKDIDGTAAGDDRGYVVATQPSGDVMSGGFTNNGADRDFTVVRLASATGSAFPCQDGADNDGDGAADYPADLGCISATDPSEIDPTPPCGNGVVAGTEQCDNGAANSDVAPDACRTDCTLPMCSDGVTDTGEQCDNGAANSDVAPNACRTSCTLAACGDGIIDSQESCDDGPANSDSAPDACRTTCALASCGDSILDAGESCDDGAVNSDTAPDACRTTCTLPACGDGVTDAAEQCDDDGITRFDGCSETCSLEGGFACAGQPTICSVVPTPQDKAQQKCLVAMNKGAAKLAAVWTKAATTCIRNASLGKTDLLGSPATAQACLTNDVGSRAQKAAVKLLALEGAKCLAKPAQLPVYAFREAEAISAAVREQAIGLTGDVYGSDLDVVLVSTEADKLGARCQAELQKSTSSVYQASLQAFITCKSGALSGKERRVGDGPVGSLMELQNEALLCLDESAGASSGKIRKAAAKLQSAIVKRCGDPRVTTPLEDLAPGCAESELGDLMSCAQRSAACRFCETANATDGFGINCDAYDDGISNLSCP